MIVTIANFKGSGKRTTAIHLAAFMQTLGPTILADGDIVRASSKWAARGDDKGMPFTRSPSANLHELVEMALKLNLDVTGHLGACRYLVDRGYRYSARTTGRISCCANDEVTAGGADQSSG